MGASSAVGTRTVLSGENPPMGFVVRSKLHSVGTRDAAHYKDCFRRCAYWGLHVNMLAGQEGLPCR